MSPEGLKPAPLLRLAMGLPSSREAEGAGAPGGDCTSPDLAEALFSLFWQLPCRFTLLWRNRGIVPSMGIHGGLPCLPCSTPPFVCVYSVEAQGCAQLPRGMGAVGVQAEDPGACSCSIAKWCCRQISNVDMPILGLVVESFESFLSPGPLVAVLNMQPAVDAAGPVQGWGRQARSEYLRSSSLHL